MIYKDCSGFRFRIKKITYGSGDIVFMLEYKIGWFDIWSKTVHTFFTAEEAKQWIENRIQNITINQYPTKIIKEEIL